jgi:hypothetical protein
VTPHHWFHVFKSYDGQRYGVYDTLTGLPSSGRRFNSTYKDRGYTQDEARVLAYWLNERERGYPKRDLPWPRSLAFSDLEGATWHTRTVRADAYDWSKGSSGQTD